MTKSFEVKIVKKTAPIIGTIIEYGDGDFTIVKFDPQATQDVQTLRRHPDDRSKKSAHWTHVWTCYVEKVE